MGRAAAARHLGGGKEDLLCQGAFATPVPTLYSSGITMSLLSIFSWMARGVSPCTVQPTELRHHTTHTADSTSVAARLQHPITRMGISEGSRSANKSAHDTASCCSLVSHVMQHQGALDGWHEMCEPM